jgi:hypothetical protein
MASIWAALRRRATNRGTFTLVQALIPQTHDEEAHMADDREKISTGPNEAAINETIAGTAPGIPDDALAPGEELPEMPSDEEVERIAEKLHSPTAEKDTLPLEGE